ncbi:hypothetical protein KSW81_001642 [Nannochloris sp. 'desiccata']|nr:hypothetical protein KSW81_001642 [Chlorella desiccata (nom. nud.)]
MISAKTGLVVVLVGVAALYKFYTPTDKSSTLAHSLPEYYWYNEVTGKTQWEEPIYEYESETYWIDPDTGKATWDKPESLGWILAEESGGKIYYWNDVTEASQWDKPANLGWMKVKYEPPSGNEYAKDTEGDSDMTEL